MSVERPKMTVPTDPVLDVLTRLHRKNPPKLDKKDVESAIEKYNTMVGELERLKVQEERRTREPQSSSKSQEKIETLRKENANLKTEIDKLKTRLSQVIGAKLTEGNPQLSDLSDPNRPLLLAEKFKLVYDEEWVHAYEDLEKIGIQEPGSLKILAEIIRAADDFCKQALEQMTAKIGASALDDVTHVKFQRKKEGDTAAAAIKGEPNESDESKSKRLVNAYIKEMGHLSLSGLINLYDSLCLKPLYQTHKIRGNHNGINEYVQSIVKYMWLMQLADPPMVLQWQEKGEPFSKDISAFYTRTGKTVVFAVWPTVLLHKGGPVALKGIVVAD